MEPLNYYITLIGDRDYSWSGDYISKYVLQDVPLDRRTDNLEKVDGVKLVTEDKTDLGEASHCDRLN